MAAHLLGRKVGMTRVYTDDGTQVPVTVIQAGPCFVSQVKTPERDGYAAVQIAYGPVKPRRSTFPVIGHDAKAGLGPMRRHREFRVTEDELAEYQPGQELNVDAFEGTAFVDVIGTSKGKGFAGVMKRHNFKGQLASHGVERKHRSAGSISSHASDAGGPGGPKKGKKMPGRMGNERVTVRSLQIVRIDNQRKLILVKGTVPGARDGIVEIRPARRLYRSKAELARAS
jgi:large subunit ribosomal protein L3